MDGTALLKPLQSHVRFKAHVSQNKVQGNYVLVLLMPVPLTSHYVCMILGMIISKQVSPRKWWKL